MYGSRSLLTTALVALLSLCFIGTLSAQVAVVNIEPEQVTKPFRFDIKKDLNDWVLWNKQRDETLGDI